MSIRMIICKGSRWKQRREPFRYVLQEQRRLVTRLSSWLARILMHPVPVGDAISEPDKNAVIPWLVRGSTGYRATWFRWKSGNEWMSTPSLEWILLSDVIDAAAMHFLWIRPMWVSFLRNLQVHLTSITDDHPLQDPSCIVLFHSFQSYDYCVVMDLSLLIHVPPL